MLLNDLDKTTLDVINARPHDILLIDLIDERFNLVASGQSLFSFSGELANSGLDFGGRVIIKPDTDEFLSLWAAGFARLLSSVDNSKVAL